MTLTEKGLNSDSELSLVDKGEKEMPEKEALASLFLTS